MLSKFQLFLCIVHKFTDGWQHSAVSVNWDYKHNYSTFSSVLLCRPKRISYTLYYTYTKDANSKVKKSEATLLLLWNLCISNEPTLDA